MVKPLEEAKSAKRFIYKRARLVPRAGIEPARGYPRGILSPLRLPIPPPRQPLFPMV